MLAMLEVKKYCRFKSNPFRISWRFVHRYTTATINPKQQSILDTIPLFFNNFLLHNYIIHLQHRFEKNVL
jgi:hypothetical protein